MKKYLLLFIAFLIVGCANQGESLRTYIENPKYLIKDPHYEDYQSVKDGLESQYLRKEITYADYMQKVSDLDNKYTKEVKERNEIVAPSQSNMNY